MSKPKRILHKYPSGIRAIKRAIGMGIKYTSEICVLPDCADARHRQAKRDNLWLKRLLAELPKGV